MADLPFDLPENGTMVRILTKNPTQLLTAQFIDGEFKILNHWAIKSVPVENIEIWDYVGQS